VESSIERECVLRVSLVLSGSGGRFNFSFFFFLFGNFMGKRIGTCGELKMAFGFGFIASIFPRYVLSIFLFLAFLFFPATCPSPLSCFTVP